MNFSKSLIDWYLQNKRDLPWRNTKDPYHIWLSEIILQQTKVNQGLSYYKAFIHNFPTVFDLAKADEKEVLNIWQGLGYYSRARNLHFSAKYIVQELQGELPKTYAGLLKLKGVGDYTASAIASICYKEPTAVVDGNVYRVLSRYFAIDIAINSTKGIKEFKKLAQQLINIKNPDIHNQAIMEFGAMQCKPQNPNCTICPLNTSCGALQKNIISKLPIKLKKGTIKKRYFNFIVLTNPYKQTYITQRNSKDIWQGLYQFPLLETSKEISKKELIKTSFFNKLTIKHLGTDIFLFNKKTSIHKLSHQHLFVKFWILNSPNRIENAILWSDLKNYPVPILIHNFVENYKR